MTNSTNKWDKKVLDAYSLFVQGKDKLEVDDNIKGTICVLTEVFLRYLVASTVDCMPISKKELQYDDIQRAISSDKELLFLSGAFSQRVPLENIQNRRQSNNQVQKQRTKRVLQEVIELD
ncbi:hypothetical protein M3Y97_00299300 [Aphelenchoides bicaudatus]|nr:hypothetical protein M3Y97_00299300 [Aphelenchoides bicaudatus]